MVLTAAEDDEEAVVVVRAADGSPDLSLGVFGGVFLGLGVAKPDLKDDDEGGGVAVGGRLRMFERG